MSRRDTTVKWLNRLGVNNMLDQYWGINRLTVLNYHRIADVNDPNFVGYAPNVSCDVDMFERQIAWAKDEFNIISLDTLRANVKDGAVLPEKPLLITFDDGYLDNYTAAFPVMQKYDVPAVIFLMTSRMEKTHELAWWAACAEIFKRTQHTHATLPIIGERTFDTTRRKSAISNEMIRALKFVPEAEKLSHIATLKEQLEVNFTLDKPIFCNWEQVRELVAGNVACQPHTHTHPIMTRISRQQVHHELATSKALIEEHTDQTAYAFAYPNGTRDDFDETTMEVLRELDYELAFTLEVGPMRASAIPKNPLAIKRVFLSHNDTFDIFRTKVMGLPAFIEWLR
ncbi:MAG: polysaccharide deacetylase family protein [Chloroflexota bacterium]